MSFRYPPDNLQPTVKRGGKSPYQTSRLDGFGEPRRGFIRRWLRRLTRPYVIIPLVFVTTVSVGILGYYWYVFSGRIDKLLNGEVFTKSAGIYAAPKSLRVGESISIDELTNHLKRADYVEKNVQAESSRGRFSANGVLFEIEPSRESTVDGQSLFAPLRVRFARSGKSIESITDQRNGVRLEFALLEPERITSLTGADRTKRKVVGFNDLPPHLVKGIVVTEDRSFFDHYGVNIRGILRALAKRVDADQNSPIARQGGSGITQQLVLNLFLTRERTLKRKLAEAYMSVILETRLSKEQIFALYCNKIYLGQQSGFSINGVGEAAEAYFNKDVTALTLPESAFIASIIRSPNRYNPYRDPQTATSRRNQVLQSMAETGAITALESAQAQATELKAVASRGRIDMSDAPYFVDYAQAQLNDLIAEQSAAEHLRIYTTIDMDLQRAAYTAMTKQLAALDKVFAKRVQPGTLQAALVAMNAKTGEIVAMVGGRDYSKSQLNRAADAMRQPGSVFKPFVYATALNTAYDPIPRVMTAATVFKDEPKTFHYDNQEYSPGNFGDKYTNAPVTLRDAMVKSLNVVTVDVAMEVSVGRVMNLAAKAGLPKSSRVYPSMALGANEATPLQIASAYTAFAAKGTRVTPIAISRVTTGKGMTVAAPTGQRNDVMRPQIAYLMTDIMRDVVNRGTAARLRGRGLTANVAGKTGTSRDGWFAGYTPNLVCVVWVGFDDGSQLGLTGAESALPIWGDFMSAALKAHPDWAGDWEMPSGIVKVEINTETGLLPKESDVNRREELFVEGTAPETDTPPKDEAQVSDDAPPPDSTVTTEPVQPSASPQATRPRIATPDDGRAPATEEPVRLQGTVTLDIDPTTGLIAATTCPVIRSKTFLIGQEPRRMCGPELHSNKPNSQPPARSRPPNR